MLLALFEFYELVRGYVSLQANGDITCRGFLLQNLLLRGQNTYKTRRLPMCVVRSSACGVGPQQSIVYTQPRHYAKIPTCQRFYQVSGSGKTKAASLSFALLSRFKANGLHWCNESHHCWFESMEPQGSSERWQETIHLAMSPYAPPDVRRNLGRLGSQPGIRCNSPHHTNRSPTHKRCRPCLRLHTN